MDDAHDILPSFPIPRVQRRDSSNVSEPSSERAYLNQLLDTTKDEISRLTAVIDKLVLEREALQSNAASYKLILASIRRLPQDILREIFVRCLPSNKAAATAVTQAPLLLGRICRLWREISLSTPELWASIHIRFQFVQPFDPLRVKRLCQKAQAWIARSGTCLLTIGLTGLNRDPITNQFIQSLLDSSRRWRSIEFRGPAESLTWLASLSKSDVPNLEKFAHTDVKAGNRERDSPICSDFWRSLSILEGDRLHDLGLQITLPYNAGPGTPEIDFGRLIRLNLDVGSGHTLMYAAAILSRCSNLVACSMWIVIYPYMSITFQPVALLHLTSFSLKFSTASPNISADISYRPYRKSFDTASRNAPQQSVVIDYLRATGSIKRLQFERPRLSLDPEKLTDDMARLMALLMATDIISQVICPFLEVLELLDCRLTDAAFVELVRHRAAFESSDGKRHLRSVRVNFPRKVDFDVVSQLDELVASEDFSLKRSQRTQKAKFCKTVYFLTSLKAISTTKTKKRGLLQDTKSRQMQAASDLEEWVENGTAQFHHQVCFANLNFVVEISRKLCQKLAPSSQPTPIVVEDMNL
ncbi:hypothetical protein C8J56DRAFT_885712 [Mycena floridula]|nr:hypothetical protein C8J56DRAFT_885712 [Mycena floridula]